MDVRRLVRELWAGAPGRAGLILLTLLMLASLYVAVAYPADFGTARWASPAVWADLPKAAPPAWTQLLAGRRRVEHQVLEATAPAAVEEAGAYRTQVFELPFLHRADEAPTFLSLALEDVTYHARPPLVSVSLLRPDGHEITLYRQVVAGPRPGERSPYRRYVESPLRVVLSSEARAAEAVNTFLRQTYGAAPAAPGKSLAMRSGLTAALFGVPAESGGFQVLKGPYRARVRVTVQDARDTVGRVRLAVGGSVYGLMGTDALGRDLAQGLLFGLPVALLIGLATSTVSTGLGTALGLLSGYVGGRVDTAIQRAADVVANVPVLPLLIFMVFIGGTQLWLILLVLVAFSWPGLTIVVRSMALQLRGREEVEAARALGASRLRVMWRHVFPHAAAYVVAQMVFFAPSAILAEAGLSFLGLGDPSIPTWGQILEDGFRTGAVFLGYWWWVVPPGLLIVVTAVTFMLLALGLEPAVDPRLRGNRPWRS
ncbi:ABC transporter permease [Limnochorda pilosa]|uniref:ABC transmembrane type-1 domain-containing protein n=1 Tax=Limnochorda pilosa TaxID=1555112 RepID=A0A0K2SHV7_LIMPI|nr:ABC transporter permease [Limnochorda pilosa]BAS26434.1 hypothetical protein LIP_0577 [Limnochorda pilosa]